MELTVHIPDEVVPQLQAAGGDLSRRALEALALEEYRGGRITRPELRRMLGLATRDALDAFLKVHDVYEGHTFEEIQQQVDTLERLGF